MEAALSRMGGEQAGVATAETLLSRATQVYAWLENEHSLSKARVLSVLVLMRLSRSSVHAEEPADVVYWKAHLLGAYVQRVGEARALAREGGRRWPDQNRFVELEYPLFQKQGNRRN